MAEGDVKGGPLLCSECFAELAGRTCAEHPDDPPLDPTRPEVKDMLADKDYEGLDSLKRKFMGIAMIPGVITLFAMEAFKFVSDEFISGKLVFMVAAVVLIAGMTIGRKLANRRFKPRFARWTGRDYRVGADVEAMFHEMRNPDND
jgi:hypothetical protein